MVTTLVQNPPLKWHGGKQPLAKWLHSLAPAAYTHRNIVFGGGLGEFWNWLPIDGVSEAVNDTNGDLVNFYAVLRSDLHFPEFVRTIGLTPFADESFYDAYSERPFLFNGEGCVTRACAFFTAYRQSRQGLAKDYATPTKRVRRGMNENVSAWLSAVDGLDECHERLRRVEIRNLDCIDFINKYDHPLALFYCDPPYLAETRSSGGEYGPHEMTAEQHGILLGLLSTIKGKFMLSGYRSDLYDTAAGNFGWTRHENERPNSASSSKTKEMRVECVWTNY